MSKTPFGFPIPTDCLTAFCHPAESHVFHLPRRIGSHIVAANGHVAIRCTRGRWMDHDFHGASDPYVLRFSRLPWARLSGDNPHAIIDPVSVHWRSLDDARGTIYRHAVHAVFCRRTHRLNPCPAVRVGECVIIPLSILQLIARLPRVEVYTLSGIITDPLFFRFTGGEGIVANHRLQDAAFGILRPARDFSGNIAPPPHPQTWNFGTPPPPEPPLENWPPSDTSE